jgi:hypothetical protein
MQPIRDWFLTFVDRAIACSHQAPPPMPETVKSGTYSYDMILAAQGALSSAMARSGIFDSLSLAMDALAYAHEISGDEKYVRAGLLSLQAMIDSAVFRSPVSEGKPFAMIYRTWINYLKLAAESGYLQRWEWERQ